MCGENAARSGQEETNERTREQDQKVSLVGEVIVTSAEWGVLAFGFAMVLGLLLHIKGYV